MAVHSTPGEVYIYLSVAAGQRTYARRAHNQMLQAIHAPTVGKPYKSKRFLILT